MKNCFAAKKTVQKFQKQTISWNKSNCHHPSQSPTHPLTLPSLPSYIPTHTFTLPSLPPPQAYNITNDSPLPFWAFLSQLLTGLGYPRPSRSLPYSLVYVLALLLHLLCLLLSPLLTLRPTFTPMRVALAGTHHHYSCKRAQRDFGYSPPVSLAEGVEKTLEHFAYLKKQS